MAPKQSKAITIFRLLCLGYHYMVSSCCERQVGELGPPQTTLWAQQHRYLRFICEILKCRGTVLIKKINNESTELQLGGHWLCRWWVGKSCLGPDTQTEVPQAGSVCSPQNDLKTLCAFPPSLKQLTNDVCTCFLLCPQDFSAQHPWGLPVTSTGPELLAPFLKWCPAPQVP